MDWLTFVSTIVKAVVWPVTVALILLLQETRKGPDSTTARSANRVG